MKVCFATHNLHKVEEISHILPQEIHLVSLEDIGWSEEIPETGSTLEENSRIKALAVYNAIGTPAIADDTGLEVDALNGAPGVFSARYAGPDRNSEANMRLLLDNLRGKQNRKARFRTVITFADASGTRIFEGIVTGSIIEKPRGEHGFGYDPVFLPEGEERTFAEMPLVAKNMISHRARAFAELNEFLKQYEY